ncbi:MAG: GDYXXLXY domain-containing protein [Chitinophagales bacterium]|nr:GDYXXLXY domain-containing protein [Chitinophagales bacterium]MCZ2392332.1 GDYXXLXY domain-containing protein [Chitinophagales bacterium]
MKRSWVFAIIVLVLAQLLVPSYMIWHKEQIKRKGKTFYIEIKPIDPYDYMKGKYIELTFRKLYFEYGGENLTGSRNRYATFSQDDDKSLFIESIGTEPPKGEDYYLRVNIDKETNFLNFYNIPPSGFFINEYKIDEIESAIDKWQDDSENIVYALVKIYKGEMVVEDIIIDGKSLSEVISNQ